MNPRTSTIALPARTSPNRLVSPCKGLFSCLTISFGKRTGQGLLTLLMLIFGLGSGIAQVVKPTEWTVSISPAAPKVGSIAELVFKVRIESGWYLYSSDFDPNIGPTVTTVKLKPSSSYETLGKLIPIHPKKKFDPIWNAEIKYFVGKAEFRQKVKIKAPVSEIGGAYDAQACTDVDGRCIPSNEDFIVKLSTTGSATTSDLQDQSAKAPTATNRSAQIDIKTASADTNNIKAQAEKQYFDSITSAKATTPLTTDSATVAIPTQPEGAQSDSLFGFFLLSFFAGLAALFTPCVFPMIPMTVSFFTKQQKSRAKGIRLALFYGFSIIAIYTIIGTVVARINGPEFANFLSTHWIPNLLFFVVFLLFGFSFLGAFEIVLPGTLVNRIDSESEKGGLYGVFFMALTIVVVSFSCTGPVVGSVLVASAGGAVLMPVIGMFGFSLAFALPFTAFAIFPQAMQRLPKSGGWLNSVKVVLGFIELALALKFFSIADQAYHWGILDREVYLSLWIVIFALLGFYLLGKLRFPHDSPVSHTSLPGLTMAIVVFSFVVYLIPGLWGAPLKQLSGYLPPINTQDFDLGKIAEFTGNLSAPSLSTSERCATPRHSEILHWPHGLNGYFDYKQALACAKEQDKPLFIDFTGHGCVNCREMEARVWSDPRVLKRLRENFVLVALYVDDKTELPQTEWYTSTYDNKEKTSIGKQNADFQITKFNNNAQPYYVTLGVKEQLLVQPRAHNLDVDAYIAFLDQAVANYKAGK